MTTNLIRWILLISFTVCTMAGLAQQSSLSGRFWITDINVEDISTFRYEFKGAYEDLSGATYATDVQPGDIISDYSGKLYRISSITSVSGSELRVKVTFIGAPPANPWDSFPMGGNWGGLSRPTAKGYPLPIVDGTNLSMQIAIQNQAIAAIDKDLSGVSDLENGKIFVGDGSNKSAAVVLSGDASLSSSGVITIADAAVKDAKLDKRNIGLSGFGLATNKIIMGDASGVATPVTMSGDVTLDNTGNATISDQTITLAKLKVDPAVDKDKVYVTDKDGIPTLVDLGAVGGKLPSGTTNPPSSPSLKKGDLFYNTQTEQLLVFDGTDWVPISVGGSTPAGDPNPDPLTAKDGDVFYNTLLEKLFVFANGAWVPIDAGGSTPGGNTPPDATVSQKGDLFYDLDDEQLLVFNGADWVPVSMGGSTPVGGTNPADADANEGDVFYNSTEKKFYVFNGTDWVVVGSAPSGTANPPEASAKIGEVFYNSLEKKFYVFDGTNWISVGGGTPNGGTNPPTAGAKLGDVFYNTTRKKFYVFDGTDWISVGGGTPNGGTNPPAAGAKLGDVFYNTTEKKFYVFDGTDWISVGGGTPNGGTNPPTAGAKLGDVFYNTTEKKFYVFDGTDWISVGGGTPSGGANPASGAKIGDTFYNTSTSQLMVYDGSDWVPVGGSTFPSGGTNPVTGAEGDVFYNTSDNILYVHDGSAWVPFKDYSGTDNLGNHTATENVKLGAFFLSSDGAANKGLSFDVNADASFSDNIKIAGRISKDGSGSDGEGLSFEDDGDASFGQNLTVNGNLYTPSDNRLKTKVETLTNVMQAINEMRGVKFEYIDQKKYASGVKIGVIAQELRKVYPEMVTIGNDGFLKVDYTQLSAVLIEAVKVQQAEIRQLNARLDAQQQQIDAILKRLNKQ